MKKRVLVNRVFAMFLIFVFTFGFSSVSNAAASLVVKSSNSSITMNRGDVFTFTVEATYSPASSNVVWSVSGAPNYLTRVSVVYNAAKTVSTVTYSLKPIASSVSVLSNFSIKATVNRKSVSVPITVTLNELPPPADTLKYVALGDSIPYGYYSSSLLNYLAGGTNTNSHVEQFSTYLDIDSTVEFVNKSVSGYNTIDVLNQVNTLGTLLSQADVITLCVGANDIMDAAARSTSGLSKYSINWALAETGRANFANYWPQLIDKIETLNPDVTLIVMTIYNPYRLSDSYYSKVDPYFTSSSGNLGLNYIITNTETLYDSMLGADLDYQVADVYSAFNAYSNKDSLTGFYRSFCDPHPNQTGQNLIFSVYKTIWESSK